MWQAWLIAAIGLLALYLLMTAADQRQQVPDAGDAP
jgi:hypothetical protein